MIKGTRGNDFLQNTKRYEISVNCWLWWLVIVCFDFFQANYFFNVKNI